MGLGEGGGHERHEHIQNTFFPLIQHLDCLYLLGRHSLVVGKCLPTASPHWHSWKNCSLFPLVHLFHCGQSHVFIASATMTSADGLHNAWNPDITQDPERVLRLHTLLVYRRGGELWITGDRVSGSKSSGTTIRLEMNETSKDMTMFWSSPGVWKIYASAHM